MGILFIALMTIINLDPNWFISVCSFRFMKMIFLLLVSVLTLVRAIPRSDCGNYTTKIPFSGTRSQIPRAGSQILGGVDASLGHWPWMASVQRRAPSGDWEPHCGGSLIRDNWVLTAANCVPDGVTYRVVLGALDLAAPDGQEQAIATQQIIRHENFDPASENRANDVALIQLARNATIVRYRVDNICVPPADFTRPTILQEAHVDVISLAECDEEIDITGPDLLDTQICTMDQLSDTRGACSGDEGGPLQCRIDGQWDVVGIASWHGAEGPDCDPLSPTIYTRTQSFRQWIHDRVGEPAADNGDNVE
ncbi:unnamed protein product [Owenia fusiformis]|uniref:Peptidase S1 domain-containing protein n=1 Tax=Owenia fusiformis TaxID=6347 RepID=A0A8S4NXA7_OWEFU|nr:unnamed protein product [Owenia fusiformis]